MKKSEIEKELLEKLDTASDCVKNLFNLSADDKEWSDEELIEEFNKQLDDVKSSINDLFGNGLSNDKSDDDDGDDDDDEIDEDEIDEDEEDEEEDEIDEDFEVANMSARPTIPIE